ncbi:MAG: hypothetical protein FWH14_08730 [Oscillospiraceae bacterium]|nr:hypothetical protein [Oscillospiraceae bacterium]
MVGRDDRPRSSVVIARAGVFLVVIANPVGGCTLGSPFGRAVGGNAD